ncbi:MAG: RNA-binding protein [Eubacteriales bacterium]|nr:RNA-binding protein [Eubacteriales bacterium]
MAVKKKAKGASGGSLKGSVAISLAGRDKGVRYAVTGITEEGYALVVDGKLHKAAYPKRKKLKHLQFDGVRIENIDDILSSPGGTADAALRRALKLSAVHHEDEMI